MKLRLLTGALAAIMTLGAQAGDLQIVEVDWDDFRHYVAAHAWIADIDFKEGEIRGLHVCAGFNAFNHYGRDPAQMSRYGFEAPSDANPELQAAAFAITINTPTVMNEASFCLQELQGSEEYKSKTGDERLAHAREFLWRHVSSDPDVEIAVRETAQELHEAVRKLIDAGLVPAGDLPDNPYQYMLGVNILLGETETVETVIADERFRALADIDARRRFFADELSGHIAATAGIEDEQQRSAYRKNMRESIDKLFNAGGSYTLSISR